MPLADQPILLAALQLLVLAGPACALAALLRAAQAPGGARGAAMVAGIFVGMVLGPTVAGQAWPGLHEPLFLGGVEERRVIEEAVSQQRAEIAAMREAGMSPQRIDERDAEHAEALKPLRDDLDDARSKHRDNLFWLAIGVACLHLVVAGLIKMPARAAAFRVLARTLVARRAMPVAIGITITLLCVLPAAAGANLLIGLSPARSLAFGIVFGIPGVAATLRPSDYLVALSAAALALVGAAVAGFSLQMVAVGGAILVSGLLPTGLPSAAALRLRRLAPRALDAVTLPTLVALAAVHIDLYEIASTSAFWIALVVALLWSSDGRWAATALAWQLLGRDEPQGATWRRATRMLDAGTGVAQLIAAVVFVSSGVLGEGVLAAAIAGAALIELTSGARRWLLRSLLEQERITPQ